MPASRAARVNVERRHLERSLALAEREHIDLTVVGPELPLDRGIVDRFAAPGRISGRRVPPPSSSAARCSRRGSWRATVSRRRATAFATPARGPRGGCGGELGHPVVVKADGLAAGKGVVVAADRAEAEAAVRASMEERQFGERVPASSSKSASSARKFVLRPVRRHPRHAAGSAQDHKRVFDDDRGPNTGGMGAFSPSPLMDEALAGQGDAGDREPVSTACPPRVTIVGFSTPGLMLTCDGRR